MASLFFVFLLALLSAIPLSYQTIPLGSSLSTTRDEASRWLSPSGEFAFGFRPLLNSTTSFFLAVWFDKIPEKTIVWCANRDKPLQLQSRVDLTNDGRLVLYDHQGREIWKKPGGVTGRDIRTASAMMKDSGSFALLSTNSSSSDSIWESFSEPTDTLLPTQILNRSGVLSSPRSASDFSKGKFQLRLQADGDLILYLVAVPSGFTYAPYWVAGTKGTGLQLVFSETGYIYLTQSNGTSLNLTQGDVVSPRNFYHRATVDFDGVLRQYVYPKTEETIRNWAPEWSVVMYEPPNVCLAVLTSLGSGTCGFNSFCALDENQRTSCRCPPGYTFMNPNDSFGGCRPDFPAQDCSLGGLAGTANFEMKEMRNVDWPLNDYEKYYPADEDSCRKDCLEDCFCAVAIFKDDRCWKKRIPLSNGKMDYNVSRKTLVKTPRVLNSSLWPLPAPSLRPCREKDRTALILIGSVLFGGSGLLNALLLLVICSAALLSSSQSRKKRLTGLRVGAETSGMLGMRIRFFSYGELEKATNGFKEEMDRGAFGAVYRGTLNLGSVRQPVAVKVLDKAAVAAGGEGADGEFATEIDAVGQTHHRNLARMLGFCSEGPYRLLVYEFMSGGSLAGFLFGSMRPSWNRRMQIALGVARGLAYLHDECEVQIVHCDINPHNVLLDDCFTPRISGFGLAKLMKADQTRSVTEIRGTRGYVAPEWFRDEPITAMVDVYSFGTLLLEVVCCRRNILESPEAAEEERAILTDWAYDCYVEGKVKVLVENDEEAVGDLERVERMVMVAIWCIQERPEKRPSMARVTEMMEGVVEVPEPMHPYSSFTLSSLPSKHGADVR